MARFTETEGCEPLDLKTTDDKSGVLISTVLLKVDHSDLSGNYETCIFDEANRGKRSPLELSATPRGIGSLSGPAVLATLQKIHAEGCDSEVVERYHSAELARAGHEKWVARVAERGYAASRWEDR